jgi:hypothetical protein
MPSIYNYLNYREYIRDYFIEQKQFKKQLTHRAVLKKKWGLPRQGSCPMLLPVRKT